MKKTINCIYLVRIKDKEWGVEFLRCKKLMSGNKMIRCLEDVGRTCNLKKAPGVDDLPYLLEYKGLEIIYFKKEES